MGRELGAYELHGLAVRAANVVVAPHRFELGSLTAEFVDERPHFRRGSRARRVHSVRAQHETGNAFPVVLCSADARVEEDEAQDIALLRWPAWMVKPYAEDLGTGLLRRLKKMGYRGGRWRGGFFAIGARRM